MIEASLNRFRQELLQDIRKLLAECQACGEPYSLDRWQTHEFEDAGEPVSPGFKQVVTKNTSDGSYVYSIVGIYWGP